MAGYTACEWPVSYLNLFAEDEQGTGCSAIDDLSEQQRELLEQAAIDLLWMWTGRVFGVCEVAVRPCRSTTPLRPSTFKGGGPHAAFADGAAGAFGWLPYNYLGRSITAFCGSCGDSCSCSLDDGTKSINLRGPVQEVSEVRVNGQLLGPYDYRLLYNKYLVRTDGQSWPLTQDLSRESHEEDTFEVLYRQGTPVPSGGQIAAGRLTCELAKALTGDEDCQLPERLQTITRQGVTVGIADTFEDLAEGKTGIWVIDSWVQSVKQVKPVVLVRSPDVSPNTSRGVSWRR